MNQHSTQEKANESTSRGVSKASEKAQNVVLPKDAKKEPPTEPLQAAKGNDEVMSLPPERKPADAAAQLKANWAQCVGAAHANWERIDEDALLATASDHHKLAALIQKHYDVELNDAYEQVKRFFDDQKL